MGAPGIIPGHGLEAVWCDFLWKRVFSFQYVELAQTTRTFFGYGLAFFACFLDSWRHGSNSSEIGEKNNVYEAYKNSITNSVHYLHRMRSNCI